MKKYLPLILSLIFITNCGATRAIYGIPEEQWQTMNEQQRSVAIERFKRQQKINEQTRIEAEKTKQEAHEFARKCERKTMSDPTECRVKTRRGWLFELF